MNENSPIGVFFYDIPGVGTDQVDYTALCSFVSRFSEVKKVWRYSNLPWNESIIRNCLVENGFERIIIAGSIPGTIKSLFTKVMALSGKDPGSVELVSFSKYGIHSVKESERAEALMHCAIKDIPFEIAAMPGEAQVNPATLIIGAGIAGIQASLEIANSNALVYLLEKSGTIGGKMATFDKTFPTLDCAACILTPKMVEVNQHSNIRLLTCSEVKSVSGGPGNYSVTITQHARRVNVRTCIGCGTCAEKCPAQAPSEFDSATTMRKAIYMPFPQAVPNKYMVDASTCLYLKNGKCKACVKACPVPGCINLDEQDTEINIIVGNIIVATGYKPFDAKRMPQYGYGKYPNVLTSLEFERLLNASGPTGGNIHLRSMDKKGNPIFNTEAEKPERVAIIHCVGSRDKNFNKYCSRVCCMYSLKFAHLVLDKLPDAEVYEYFIDMRAFGKGYEEFYERIREEGIVMIRGKTAMVEEIDGKLQLRGEDILENRLHERTVDMVILSTGLEPSDDTRILADILGIHLSEGGWLEEANYTTDPTGTFKGGIYLAGTCQGPRDIPDSVAQGSAAAARVIQNIIRGSVTNGLTEITTAQIEKNLQELFPVH